VHSGNELGAPCRRLLWTREPVSLAAGHRAELAILHPPFPPRVLVGEGGVGTFPACCFAFRTASAPRNPPAVTSVRTEMLQQSELCSPGLVSGILIAGIFWSLCSCRVPELRIPNTPPTASRNSSPFSFFSFFRSPSPLPRQDSDPVQFVGQPLD